MSISCFLISARVTCIVETSRKVNVPESDPHPACGRLSSLVWVLCGRSAYVEASTRATAINLYMGVVELREGAIVELELSINKKSTNMRSKMLKEAELVKQINKYLYNSHGRGDFGDLV